MSHASELSPAGWSAARARNVVLWVLQVGAAATFYVAGLGKLFGEPSTVALFESLGAGHWFRYLTGIVEITGATLLLVPAFAGLGALLLSGVMLGAVATHLFAVGGSPLLPIILLAVLGAVGYGRWQRTLRLVQWLRGG